MSNEPNHLDDEAFQNILKALDALNDIFERRNQVPRERERKASRRMARYEGECKMCGGEWPLNDEGYCSRCWTVWNS